jgi:hypothetical protein
MIESIDNDGSGQVEFSEFMTILKGHKKAYSRPEMSQKFIQTEFKDIMRGKHKQIKSDQNIPLNFILRNYKRQIILSKPKLAILNKRSCQKYRDKRRIEV